MADINKVELPATANIRPHADFQCAADITAANSLYRYTQQYRQVPASSYL